MRAKLTFRLLLCFILSAVMCHAQRGKLLTVDRELSSSMLNSIYQDRDGILWIATEDGLSRYDGAKFTIFRHKPGDTNSLANNYVRVLFEDRDGRFFIGSLGGLQRYDRARDRFTRIPLLSAEGDTLTANVSSIIQRRDGRIFIGTAGHNLFVLDPKKDSLAAHHLPDLVSSLINQVYEDRKGRLWVASNDRGVFRLDAGNHVRQYYGADNLVWSSSLCEDEQGNIYAGCLKNGLFRYDERQDRFVRVGGETGGRMPVKTLCPVVPDGIYVGTDGEGMKVYHPSADRLENVHVSTVGFNFDKAKVHAILEDNQGNLWLGLFQKGVLIVPTRSSGFRYLGYKVNADNPIGSSCIMAVCKDRDNRLWVGTDNDGLYCVAPDANRLKHFAPGSRKGESVSATVTALFEDSDRNLWVGSYRDGLARLDPQTGRCTSFPLYDDKGAPVQSVYSITEDRHKHLWVGSLGSGIYRINLRTKEVFHLPYPSDGRDYREESNVLNNPWVNCLLCSSDDKLYFGSYDGLGCLDLPTMNFVSTFGKNRLLPGEVVYALHEDRRGDLWAGTSFGLKRITPRTGVVKTYTTADGLPSNSISAIEEDGDGNLWVSTNFGISKFTPAHEVFVNFYAGDGLQGNEFSKRVSFAGSDGELIFGGTGGITLFDPRRISSSNKRPDIRIADFYLHDRAVRPGMQSGGRDIVDRSISHADCVRLAHTDNSFSIEFSAMEFYNPERISYSYTFNDSTWVHLRAGINRVSFSDLAPGTYHFRVKARSYDTDSAVRQLTIIVSPAWYASGWAKAAYVLLAAALAAAGVLYMRQRYRARQEMMEHIHAEQLNEAKVRFFINISHEIRTPMSLIISPLQKLMAGDADPVRQQSYHTIYRNAERILRLVNQLMDIRKIDKGQMRLHFCRVDIVGFIADLYHTFEDQAATRRIDFTFRHEDERLDVWIDPQNFDKVLMNVLSNAFKYTPEGGHIDVSLTRGTDPDAVEEPLRNYFEIRVTDNGCGIDESEISRIFDRFYQVHNTRNESQPGTGVGLHLTRSLVRLHHGTIQAANNADGAGCHFTIRLPLGSSHLTANELDAAFAPAVPVRPASGTAPQTDTDAGTEGKAVHPKSSYRVLVVEDDEEIRSYICRELATDFYTEGCGNGKEALELIFKRPPHLIISDVMMPEMDGIALCTRVKQNINLNHIPVVLLTAKTREEDNLEGLNCGADAYLTKPFSIEILRRTVQNLINNRKLLQNKFGGSQTQEKRMQKLHVESPDERLLNRVMKVINDNMANPDLSVDMLAKKVGISRVHLYRKLKELTNQSASDLIRNVRLKQAAALLAAKRQSINEVATRTGFANVNYFSTAFKELYGLTPTAYMEQCLKASDDGKQ